MASTGNAQADESGSPVDPLKQTSAMIAASEAILAAPSSFPKSREMIAELNKYVIVEPKPFAVNLAESKGMYLASIDGPRIFDWAGYYGSKLITHNHPGLYTPEYTKRLLVAANNKTANPDFLTQECLDYYRLLHRIAPKCMRSHELEIYAVNSGAEAVENMLKYFIVIHNEKLRRKGILSTASRRFLYFDRAYHGRTLFSLSVTHMPQDPEGTKDFLGMVAGNLQIKFPAVDASQSEEENSRRTDESLATLNALLEAHSDEIVAIITEPIQGAGGHRVAQKRFFQGLSELCHKYEVCLGFDEVQTAGGQTGAIFMADQMELPHSPHAIAVAKKFGCGVVYMRKTVGDRGVLDSTWGGTLSDMVRVVREYAIVEEENMLEQVPQKAAAMIQGLESLTKRYPELIFNVRGMGLYQGFTVANGKLKGRLWELALEQEQMLLLGAGTRSIRFRPPLDVTEADIALMIEKLDRCFKVIEEEELAAKSRKVVSAAPGDESD
eukprot:TRINITY_DN2848_c0_g1_i1.p1 TRINITY_DN2848_c0_g1~~TRINITY_DN2848_c0_g1_i1.p1  ORF type:complete len:496 (-),score=145.06 TRINITY_DN2848_c0_g1_i1:179-1666(-)